MVRQIRSMAFAWVIPFLVLAAPPLVGAQQAGDRQSPRRNAVVKAVEDVSAAVVNISSEYEVSGQLSPFTRFDMDTFFRDFFERHFETRRKLSSRGSGVIIDGERGFILTNEHVVEKSGTITVVLKDGREFKPEIIGADPESDLAVLQIQSDKTLPAIPMGDSGDIMIGETVIAIGNPFGFSNSVTTGVISAINRSVRTKNRVYHDFLQTDASINPGNSGGPLLNINGELIGVNTAIYAKAEGIGFAIPINTAKKIVSDLIAYGQVIHAWLGLTVQNIDQRLAGYLNLPSDKGIVVKDLAPGSPAAGAGIREGDVILAIGDQAIQSVSDYEYAMRGRSKGETIKVKLRRNNRETTLAVKAAIFPKRLAMDLAYRLIGVKVVDIGEKNRFQRPIQADAGVIISEVDPNSELAGIGVRPGDVILKINDAGLKSLSDFKDAVIKYRWKDSLVLLLQRGGRGYYITLQIH
ncbi:MAG: Do family serine endopeptidase [Desulfobacterales bacterium]|nr:Do family serine endopeptidase [Desulfobacterales bacterium]